MRPAVLAKVARAVSRRSCIWLSNSAVTCSTPLTTTVAIGGPRWLSIQRTPRAAGSSSDDTVKGGASRSDATVVQLSAAVETAVKEHGETSEQVLHALCSLATAAQQAGDFRAEAGAMERAFLILDGKVGRKNKHVGSLAWLWGTALLNLGGHTTKVQELMRIAIDGFKADAAARESGDGGGETVDKDTARLLAEPYAVLGSEVAKHGDRDEGIRLLTHALELQTVAHGDASFESASVMQELSCHYAAAGDYQKQADLLEAVLPIMITEFGEDSEEVSAVLVALGPAFLHLYGPEAALPVLEEALMRMEAARGKDDIALYTPLKFLGQAFGEKGDTEVQHMYWTRAIELHERHFGAPPEDPEMDVGEDMEGSVLP